VARQHYTNAKTQARSIKGGRGRPRLAGFAKEAKAFTLSVAPGTVNAGATVVVPLTVPGLHLVPWKLGRHAVTATPPLTLEPGLRADAPTVSADETLQQPVTNITGAPIVASTRDWRILFFSRA
jgi:hypothetical protein